VSPNDPLVVITRSTAPTAISDLEAFSKQRLAATRTISAIEIRNGSRTEIGAMPAHELTASAKSTDGFAIVIYQAIAYDGLHYYVLQGLVGPSLESRYMPQFRSIARSLEPR
jgi:hypothetical protein